MLDLARLDRIKLSARPRVQQLVGNLVLAPNYHLPPRVRIEVEGYERLPDEPVVYAMNHTDRFNYWPFQYHLWRAKDRFTATWVKGKYYESAGIGKFMELTNNIPTVSRGYLITRDLLSTLGRRPKDGEYGTLRALVDAHAAGEIDRELPSDPELAPLFERARHILGRPFDPASESWPQAIDAVYRRMMRRFVELNAEAFDLGLDVLIFPEGTRSIRLSKGHIGLAQIALRYGRTIVPVGCNGSDRCYPGSSPFARGGHIVYRLGEPLRPDELAAFHPGVDFEPFTPEAERAHRERFQACVDLVMERIAGLLDARHLPVEGDEGDEGGAVRGSHRFV